jgi:hypothetical protein
MSHDSGRRDTTREQFARYLILRHAVAEALHERFVVAPVFEHLHAQVDEHLCVEHLLQFLACLRADQLNHAAALADQDALLRVALDIDNGADIRHLI